MLNDSDRKKSVNTNSTATTISEAVPPAFIRGTFFNDNYRQQPIVEKKQSTTNTNANDLTEVTNLELKQWITNNDLMVTPIERRLHFTVAYSHLVSGCPLLTLEVLSKLPKYISDMSAERAAPNLDETG